MFNLISSEIQDYCEEHTSAEDAVLYELYRETNLKVQRPRMLSCKSQGTFLEFVSRLVRPKRILEVGTYTAYATICLAKGLADNGVIYTIEYEAELEEMIRKYLRKANIEQKTKLLIGDALNIIPTLDEEWDLIFIDADKVNYLNYYKILLPHLSKNGILLADNVLWSGKVIEDVKSNDKDTQVILAFNQYVQEDERVKNMILPFRDGIMMVRWK
jgi:predicted O-methyltransferase YrrM